MKKTFRRAFIEINNSCNLACGFCASSARPKVFMPLEVFESAAVQAGELAAVLFLHLLGEPFMHPRFPEILAACSRLGLKVNLVTNGALLDKFGPGLFKENCLAQVSVSLQALGELPPALRAESLGRILAFALRKPPGLIVSLRLRGNPAAPFIKETRASVLGAFPPPPNSRRIRPLAENNPARQTAGGQADPPSAETCEGAYKKVRDGLKLREDVYLNFGGIFDWPGGPGGRPKKGCLGLRHHFGILSDGRVVPCCADFDGALALGNINERPLAAILAGTEALALRDRIAGKTPMPAYCASCGFTAPDS